MQIVMIILLVILLTAIATALVEWLWNMTMPLAFTSAKQIDFWVAFRLLLIGALLSGTGSIKNNLGSFPA
jgi:hypothetical protein